MANYNLTSQQLKDTYQQLVQVSGSAIVDGTGSLVNAFDYPSNSEYTTFSSSVASVLDSIVAGSGSADWALITNKPAGLVSGSSQVIYSQITGVPSGILSSSSQIASEISGAFTSTSASLAAGIATNKSNIATQTSRVNSLVAATSSYAVKSSNNIFSGTQTFDNIVVNGTASIAHVQQVTGSAVIIGEEFIILNAATPAARYAGIKIYDTGSTSATASIEWDGVQDTWMLMEETGNTSVIITGPTGSRGSETFTTKNRLQKGLGYNYIGDSNISDDGSQVSITGPVSASTYYGDGSNLTGVESGLVLGSTATSLKSVLTTNTASAVSNGSVAIGDNARAGGGTTFGAGNISIGRNASTNTVVAGAIAIGDGARMTQNGGQSIAIGQNAHASSSGQIVIGTNARSFGNSAGTIVIGTNANSIDDNRTDAVIIGNGATSFQNGVAIGAGSFSIEMAVAVGKQAQNGNNYGVAIGAQANSGDSYGIAVGYQSTAGNDSIAIGYGVSATTTNEINIGDRFKYDGSSVMTLSATIVSASANLEVAGQLYSPTFAGSVASSTSSVDFNNGNFATLNLTVPTFIANPSNLKSGTTYTIIIDSGSLVSNYGSAFKFAGGTQPTLSNGVDILTMVSDGTSLYATALADFQ